MLLVHDYFYAAQIILEFYCNSAAFQFLGLLFIRFAVYCLNFDFILLVFQVLLKEHIKEECIHIRLECLRYIHIRLFFFFKFLYM